MALRALLALLVALAGTLIFVPEAMSSLTGALAVLGVAVGAALAIVGESLAHQEV